MKIGRYWFVILAIAMGCDYPSKSSTPQHWLEGNWTARAFTGRLDEYWQFDSSKGLMLKAGYYIEGSDTSYSEVVNVDTIGNSIILIAKPFNSDARIYTLTQQTPETLTFENPAYRNPFKIVYTRQDANQFTRQIIGIENNDTIRVSFEFTRMK